MTGSARHLARCGASWLCLTTALACDEEVPLPRGELVLVVDTDLAVPELASELRVDIYAMDGRWLDSREVHLGNTSDWPASFSLLNPDDESPVEVLVRLRTYPEGALRTYRGEGTDTQSPWEPPAVAESEEALCADPPKLEVGGAITARRGRFAILPVDALFSSGDCAFPYGNFLGSVAARVEIQKAGRYSFAVVKTSPTMPGDPPNLMQQVTLELREACDDHQSGIACAYGLYFTGVDQGQPYHPSVEADLQPGTYHLVTGGLLYNNGAADITLAAWSDDVALFETVASPVTPEPSLGPWLADDVERTPVDEPIPAQTVDRLIAVRVEPHQRKAGHVVLRGECSGLPARLANDPGVVVPSEATTCVGDRGSAEAPAGPEQLTAIETGLASPLNVSVQGSFASSEPCEAADSTSAFVCVPSGAYVRGSGRAFDASGMNGPNRVAAVRRFWIDRTELTVADYRLVEPTLDLIEDDLPVSNPKKIDALIDIDRIEHACTWSEQMLDREAMPMNCINWFAARAFCQARGGDLPTSAQWEWAATRAGHERSVHFPWGDAVPACSCSGEQPACRAGIFDRDPFDDDPSCSDTGFAWAPAASIGGPTGDESPLGIVGLASNVREWTRDAVGRLDHPCSGDTLWDPVCDEPTPTARMVRGGSFVTSIVNSRSTFFLQPAQVLHDLGVRCVYDNRPF